MRGSSRWVTVAAALVVLPACRIEGGAPLAGTDTLPGIETQVGRMLEASANAWNRGDLEAFMSDYLRSPTTTYLGSSGMIAGWEAIRARYAPLFEAGVIRDSLRFERVSGRPLGTDHALATARYVLFREGRITRSGPFSLVLWRTEEGWRIVHDQTASDPPPESVEADSAEPDSAEPESPPEGGRETPSEPAEPGR